MQKKLGIKHRFKIRLVNQRAYYFDLFTDFPENVEILTNKKNTKNLVHYFTKKASKIETDVTEDIIRI